MDQTNRSPPNYVFHEARTVERRRMTGAAARSRFYAEILRVTLRRRPTRLPVSRLSTASGPRFLPLAPTEAYQDLGTGVPRRLQTSETPRPAIAGDRRGSTTSTIRAVAPQAGRMAEARSRSSNPAHSDVTEGSCLGLIYWRIRYEKHRLVTAATAEIRDEPRAWRSRVC